MFCRNCAEVMLDTDITCPKCGFAAGTGVKYCSQCGSETPPGTVICEICGQAVTSVPTGDGMQFQAQPDFQQQFSTPGYQEPNTFQQPPFTQAPQYGQQSQFGKSPQFGQTSQFGQQQYGQQQYGQQQYGTRSADPNAYGQQAGYSAPNTFQQTNAGQFYQGVTYKSKVAAGLLGIFLGAFGVHNFYLGFTGKAVAQLLLTILSCGALSFVSAIWGLIEGIMVLTGSIKTDGKGLPLKE